MLRDDDPLIQRHQLTGQRQVYPIAEGKILLSLIGLYLKFAILDEDSRVDFALKTEQSKSLTEGF